MRQIKVLVVDDSLLFQELLRKGLDSDPYMTVVATASNAYEAQDAIRKYNPDVMTLDVEMPGMNGIDLLRQIMVDNPVRTVVISAMNTSVFDALNAGAVDFVNKPRTSSPLVVRDFIQDELIKKVKIASTAQIRVKNQRIQKMPTVLGNKSEWSDRIVAIGASTGGTEAISTVLSGFGTDIPGVLIVQHMPAGFTQMFANRLNQNYAPMVKEAESGDIVEPGKVLVAAGDAHMRLVKSGGRYRVECKPGDKVSGHCPSVDVMFQSVAEVAGDKAIGVILTGMGADGAKGLLKMRNVGAQTIGQDKESCVVYGMPKVAYDIGAVEHQLSLEKISGKVYNLLR